VVNRRRCVEHEVDVIIYGTGFQASKFLTPMTVTGPRPESTSTKHWKGDARAYLGITVPGFPNLFLPVRTETRNIVINGSIIYFSECGVRLHPRLASASSSMATTRALEVHKLRARRLQRARRRGETR